MSARANVLPILSQTDCLTITELEIVRNTVRSALSDLPGGVFGVFQPEFFGAEDERSRTPSPEGLDSSMKSHTKEIRPLSSASSTSSQDQPDLPFAIFNPDRDVAAGSFVRTFPWGRADAFDQAHSDFAALQHAILGSHLQVRRGQVSSSCQTLRSTTREVLYERFRTEKLLER